MTFRVERPPNRDRLTVQLGQLDPSPGNCRLREIEDEGRLANRHRGCYRQWVVAKPCLRSTPGRHHPRGARCSDSDQTALDRAERIEGRSAEVVAAAGRHEADPVPLRPGNGLVHAHRAGDRSEGPTAADRPLETTLALAPWH